MNVIFTKHARQRIRERLILDQEIQEALTCPDTERQEFGLWYLQKKGDRGILEICCEKRENHINIITVYWI